MTSPDRRSDDSVPVPRDGTRARASGTIGEVVQARDVTGGIHFHRVRPVDRDVPRQLPSDVRGFVNRATELDRLDTVLSGPGAATLTLIVGTAGVGKTALALRWAHRARDRFPDGQLYVNLRGYDPGAPVTAEQALDRFLLALEVPPARVPADLEGKASLYRSLLADRRVLAVLDNAAHVSQVRPLLPGSPGSRVIVTSRDRLAGLMARNGAERVTVEILPEAEAVDLIRTLTAAYRPADDPADVAELARLCARLPLALRIAAERAASRPWMPLTELIQDLRDESNLWDALAAENGEEFDGVRAVFAWSYRALPVDAARMFRLLGLHPGPEFGVHAAAELAAVPVPTARSLLDSIVGAHLLEQTGPDRYQFHDLLRAYATDAAHHEEPLERQYEALSRVLAWYLHTAHAAGSAMYTSSGLLPPTAFPAPTSALAFDQHLPAAQWFDLEWANLFAAVRAARKSGLSRVTWQLALASRPAFLRGVPLEDRHEVVSTALEAARADDDRQAEGQALSALASVYSHQGRRTESLATNRAALAVFRGIGDHERERAILNTIGVNLLVQRDFTEAVEHFDQLLALLRDGEDSRVETAALFNLADARESLGQYAEAIEAARASLALSRRTGNRSHELVASVVLARAQASAGILDEALASAEAAVEISRAIDDARDEGWALLDYGRVQRLAGRREDALVSYKRAATVHTALDIPLRLAASLDGTGLTYRELGRATDALGFHHQAVALARECSSAWLLGTTLDHLAGALAATGNPDEARARWREALELLGRFDDPEALARRARIAAALDATSPG